MQNTINNTDKVTNVVNKKDAAKQLKDAAKLDAAKETVIAEKITGKQLSKLQTTKIESNKLNKADLGTLSFNLSQFKKHAAKFVIELNSKHELNLLIEDLVNIKPSQFTEFLTVKEKERLSNNGNLFTFWLVESLISRYFKSIVKVA